MVHDSVYGLASPPAIMSFFLNVHVHVHCTQFRGRAAGRGLRDEGCGKRDEGWPAVGCPRVTCEWCGGSSGPRPPRRLTREWTCGLRCCTPLVFVRDGHTPGCCCQEAARSSDDACYGLKGMLRRSRLSRLPGGEVVPLLPGGVRLAPQGLGPACGVGTGVHKQA